MIKSYLRYWPLFLTSALAFVLIGYLYLRYQVPYYAAQANVKVVDQKSTELSVFSDLDFAQGGAVGELETEILSFKSRSNMIKVCKNLNLNIKYYALGQIRDSEIYKNFPFTLNFAKSDSLIQNTNATFYLKAISDTSYGFSLKEDGAFNSYSFGENIETPAGKLIVIPNLEYFDSSNLNGRSYRVEIRPVYQVAQFYQKAVTIAPEVKGARILKILLYDPVMEKAQDIIDEMIKVYLQSTVLNKKEIADKTSRFINERIDIIYSDLSTVDQSAEDFKTNRGVTDIDSQSNINLSTGAASEQELRNTQIQLNIAASMKEYVESTEGFDVLPSNIGLNDQSIATTTARYNELALQRKRLLESSNEKNPIIVNLDQQLTSLKKNMQSSLNSMTNNLTLQANSLNQQLSRINSRLYSAPRNERRLRDITRKQETTEALYLYLLEKREESQIAFASSEPNIQVVDQAYSLGPQGLNKIMVYFGLFVLGALIPLLFIYVKDLFDTKVHNKLDLERISGQIPVLAELPKLSRKEAKILKEDDRSVLAESLRILRTNIDYLLKSSSKTKKCPIIFVTSSVSGEGKTFISSNLAMVFASTNKKVLLLGADIRNPKIHSFFTGENVDPLTADKTKKGIGLTEYLSDDSVQIDDIISPMLAHFTAIDVIYSGRIPPNPSELLMSDRMGNLFEELSMNYDYIIVDTAPMLVVTDTLLITQYSDQILYVTRAGMTEKKVLNYPVGLVREGKIKKLSLLVNNVKEANLGYGGKYGYGYGKTIKKWWNFAS